MSDFFGDMLRGPADRPDHPDFWKLSDIVLRHDGPTTDPTTKHLFSMQERIAQEIDVETLTYMIRNRAGTYLQLMGLDDRNPVMVALVSSAWLDAFLVGVEWQKAKAVDAGTNEG